MCLVFVFLQYVMYIIYAPSNIIYVVIKTRQYKNIKIEWRHYYKSDSETLKWFLGKCYFGIKFDPLKINLAEHIVKPLSLKD